jgi:PhoH-like ATPase
VTAATATRRLYVLDTNVLMHDPTAIFRFEEHDIYLPMVVIEELDANKKGLSEASRNARQVSRFLDDMMRGVTKDQIDAGLTISPGFSGNHGKRFFRRTNSLAAYRRDYPALGPII